MGFGDDAWEEQHLNRTPEQIEHFLKKKQERDEAAKLAELTKPKDKKNGDER